MADDLAAIVFNQKNSAPPATVNVSPAVLQSYEGRYQFGQDFTYNPGATVIVEKTGEGLRLTSGNNVSYLLPVSENKFLDRLFGGTVTFNKSGEHLTELTWNFGRDFVAKKVQ
jgi:hypothetical protein